MSATLLLMFPFSSQNITYTAVVIICYCYCSYYLEQSPEAIWKSMEAKGIVLRAVRPGPCSLPILIN
jgi:hypothetical protein